MIQQFVRSTGSLGLLLALALTAPLGLPTPAGAASRTLPAIRDNTLYEHPSGFLSNGAGDHFFAGTTGELRVVRGLLEFDVAFHLSPGSTITGATLTLNMSRASGLGAVIVNLHRVLADWGEAGSNAPMGEGGGAFPQVGDATWIHTFFLSTFWTTAGGDFDPTPSASTSVAGLGSYSWSSAQLAADVQQFLDDPDQNHGWILVSGAAIAKRFDSRENPTASMRPELTIEFTAPDVLPSLGPGGLALLVASLIGAAAWRLLSRPALG
jgi:hypothetical protein